MEASAPFELQEIVKQYQIGKLVGYRQLHLGYVNVSFVVETAIRGERSKYFLRKYKRGITAEEIKFEHSVIDHLIEKGFDLVAGVLRTKYGATYVTRVSDEGQAIFSAVFDFLPGEDRYTWDDPACSDEELRNAAGVLAEFHDAVFDASPEGRRSEPQISDLLPSIAVNVERKARRAGDTAFDIYFLENRARIGKDIDRTLHAIREKGCAKTANLVIHCDYHPGNLKFQDSQVTGLFDFDWSKIDARCFDVALALVYFCTAWQGDQDGDFQLDKAAVFLEAYQSTPSGVGGVGPLDATELACLPHMISASNIYVLNWALEDFYGKEVDPPEYLRYLRHNVHLMRWLENRDNWHELRRRAANAH
jgi:homoserine kinase type II